MDKLIILIQRSHTKHIVKYNMIRPDSNIVSVTPPDPHAESCMSKIIIFLSYLWQSFVTVTENLATLTASLVTGVQSSNVQIKAVRVRCGIGHKSPVLNGVMCFAILVKDFPIGLKHSPIVDHATPGTQEYKYTSLSVLPTVT